MTASQGSKSRTVVLVHGGFVDGSGWESVHNILRKDGYTVAIVQNPTISLAEDVAATKRIIATQNDPVILVGHSYGGVVITEAGNDPKVAGLVYIAAFARTRASRCPLSSRTLRQARRYRRSCHRRTAIFSLTRQSSTSHLRLTWTKKRPRSWPIPKCRGAWRRSAGRSA